MPAACVDMSHLAKYANRNSPPANANTTGCRGKTVKGTDGELYTSKRRIDGVHTWRKQTSTSRRSAPRSSRALTTYRTRTVRRRRTPARRAVRVRIVPARRTRTRTRVVAVRYRVEPWIELAAANLVLRNLRAVRAGRRPAGSAALRNARAAVQADIARRARAAVARNRGRNPVRPGVRPSAAEHEAIRRRAEAFINNRRNTV
jgi:hypothetical protein